MLGLVRLAAVVIVLGLRAGSGEAQQAPSAADPIRKADPVVVTATRIEEPLERIGASVTVVPEEVFRAQEYRTVEEVLRTVPGVDVQTSGSPGRLTTIKIRGANPTQVQVLIDGVRVKSTTSGDFDFADLTLDDIERIEVVRGPQSTLYGADAIGGVVNIITRRGRGAPSVTVDVEAGNYQTYRERLWASGAQGKWSFSLGASRLDFGGQFDNDEHHLTSINGRLAYTLPNQGELALTGRYSDGYRGLPFATVFPDFDANRRQDDTLKLVSATWRQPWTTWYDSEMRASLVWTDLVFRDPDSPLTPRNDITTERQEFDFLNHIKLGDINTISAGFEYRYEAGSNQGSFDRHTDTWSLVLQDELRLWDRLFLTAGVRYDDNSVFGDQTTFRAALSYVIRETDTRLKGSWGQGFRAPTFNELFFPAFAPCPPFGNPALRPEESESWDAGVEQQLWERRVRLAATYFRNDFTDLIQTALIDPINFCFQARNVGRARTQGVEAEASITPVDGLTVSLAYTYTDTEDLDTGQELRRFPRNRVAVTATWEPLPGLTLSGQLFVVGSQFEGVGVARTDGYTVVNVGASYRLPWRWGWLRDIVLHVKAQNLLNEDYQETPGFPALGTHVVAGLRATFE